MVIAWPINLNMSCMLHAYSLQRTRSPPGPRLPRRIGNTHPRNYYNLKGQDIDVHFLFWVEELYCELNYHDQKIRRTLMHDIRKHLTAVSTLLGLISSVCHDLHHWRSNPWLQNAEPKLNNWTTNPHRSHGLFIKLHINSF